MPTFTADETALYTYRAAPVRVVDGDTVDLTIDLGFRIRWTQRFRLAGLNAPELVGPDAAKAKDAAEFLKGLLFAAHEIRVITHRDKGDKYGRWLVTIFARTAAGWTDVNEALVSAGHAVRM